MAYAYILLGAIAGAPLRYFVGTRVQGATGDAFPWGTLVVNASGCFLIGLIVQLGERHGWLTREARLLLVTGFLGSYTTFSAFSHEAYALGSAGEYFRSAAYIILSVGVGLACTWAGAHLTFGR